jgi:hypothetical protein
VCPAWPFPAMSARQKNGCGHAGAVFGYGADRFFAIAIFAAIALVAWIIGRACRYVLAGT